MPCGSDVIIFKSVNHNFVFNIMHCLMKKWIQSSEWDANTAPWYDACTICLTTCVVGKASRHVHEPIKMWFSNDNNYFLEHNFCFASIVIYVVHTRINANNVSVETILIDLRSDKCKFTSKCITTPRRKKNIAFNGDNILHIIHICMCNHRSSEMWNACDGNRLTCNRKNEYPIVSLAINWVCHYRIRTHYECGFCNNKKFIKMNKIE